MGASLYPRTSAIARTVSRMDSVFFCMRGRPPCRLKRFHKLLLRTDEHQVCDIGGLGVDSPRLSGTAEN